MLFKCADFFLPGCFKDLFVLMWKFQHICGSEEICESFLNVGHNKRNLVKTITLGENKEMLFYKTTHVLYNCINALQLSTLNRFLVIKNFNFHLH